MSDDNVRRRDVLKKGVAASTLPMAMGVASARQSRPEGNVAITGTAGVNPDVVTEDVQAIMDHDGAKTLASRIESETGFKIDDEFAIGIDLETDDAELNAHNPRILHVPMKPAGTGDISAVTPQRDANSSRPEFSIDNGGVLMALTARVKGERRLATLMGMTREKSQRRSLFARGTERVDTKSFVVQDGSAMVHRERTGQEPQKSNWQAKVGGNTSTVSPMDTGFTCWGCATVVGLACAGAATLSMSSCASAAVASGVFSPWAAGAVSAFCLYIVANAGTLSCAAGTAAICASVTGDCDFLE